METRDERDALPPKGVPKDLYDQAALLRWTRSMLGEAKSWPDGPLRTSFLEGIQSILASQPIPSKTDLEEAQKKLKSSEYLVSDLQLQIQKLESQQMIASKVIDSPCLCRFWDHKRAIFIAILIGYIICLLQRIPS